MPISHQHKLIFVHVPKTGGTSIEYALKIHGVDNKQKSDQSILFGCLDGKVHLQHLTMNEIEKQIDQDVVSEYFKFAFVRNPWDRMVSEYFWRAKWSIDTDQVSFEDFIVDHVSKNMSDSHNRPQVEYIFEKHENGIGECLVDYVGRFESLQNDFTQICKINNMNNIILSKRGASQVNKYMKLVSKVLEKTGFNKFFISGKNNISKSNYQKHYNEKTYKLVEKLYWEDIKTFEYKF